MSHRKPLDLFAIAIMVALCSSGDLNRFRSN